MTSHYRHKKRGSTYIVKGIAKAEASTGLIRDGDKIVVYEDKATGCLFVRRAVEFHDGRFEWATPSRLYYPSSYVDENMPQGEYSPEDWIAGPTDDGLWVLSPADRDDALVYGCILVGPNEEIGFEWMEQCGKAQMLIYPDATWKVDGEIPTDYTHVYDADEPSFMDSTLDDFARQHSDDMRDGDEPCHLTVVFTTWGSVRFRLEVKDRTARFVPVEVEASAEAGGGNG